MTRATIKTFLSGEQLKDGYARTLPVMWSFKAQNLLDAAKLLELHDILFGQVNTQKAFSESKLSLMPVILMLRGMAFECLFKGELTRQGKILLKGGGLDLPKKYKAHNLSNMAHDIDGLNLEKDDYVTLEILSQQIVLARLPLKQVPTKAQMEQGGWTIPHDERVYLKVLKEVLSLNALQSPHGPSASTGSMGVH